MSSSDGEAGRSARKQYEVRAREHQTKHEKLFGTKVAKIISFLVGNSKNISAWSKGADGEKRVGEFLDKFAEDNGFYVLHDRAIPGSKANIDHILISSRGIFVIDAKNYTGPIRIKEYGSAFKPKEILYVGNRNQTRLVESVKKQVATVANFLEKQNQLVPVYGMLAFVDADFPLLFKPQNIDGVLINGKGIEAGIISTEFSPNLDIEKISEILKKVFPAKS